MLSLKIAAPRSFALDRAQVPSPDEATRRRIEEADAEDLSPVLSPFVPFVSFCKR